MLLSWYRFSAATAAAFYCVVFCTRHFLAQISSHWNVFYLLSFKLDFPLCFHVEYKYCKLVAYTQQLYLPIDLLMVFFYLLLFVHSFAVYSLMYVNVWVYVCFFFLSHCFTQFATFCVNTFFPLWFLRYSRVICFQLTIKYKRYESSMLRNSQKKHESRFYFGFSFENFSKIFHKPVVFFMIWNKQGKRNDEQKIAQIRCLTA